MSAVALEQERELYTTEKANWVRGQLANWLLATGQKLALIIFDCLASSPVGQPAAWLAAHMATARASTPPAHEPTGTVAPFRAWRG